MAYGFLATNASGQVLISSDTRNLHFVGKAVFDRTIRSSDGYGGLRYWAFRISCNITPVPFFTMPVEAYYAVAAVRQIEVGTWEIEIIRSGTSDSVPEVYIFSDPRGLSGNGGTNYGMKVINSDGTPSFDSRFGPLAVIGGLSIAPPSNPLVAGPGGLSAKYCESAPQNWTVPDNANSVELANLGVKPIFYYPSLAQAQRDYAYNESEWECDGVDAYGGCIGAGRTYYWSSTYWSFFRGGIRYASNTLYCGWINIEFSCNWTYYKDSEFLGIGTGGTSGSGGTWPYSNQTLNLTATAVIVANGAHYD